MIGCTFLFHTINMKSNHPKSPRIKGMRSASSNLKSDDLERNVWAVFACSGKEKKQTLIVSQN